MLVTRGPGATNTVTGLATAYMDSIPLVVFTGQVPRVIGNDAFQESDIVGITRPVTKHNYLVTDARTSPRIGGEAFLIAPPGGRDPCSSTSPRTSPLQKSNEYEYPKTMQPALFYNAVVTKGSIPCRSRKRW